MSDFKTFAVRTARKAGTLLLKAQERLHQLEWKQRNDYKTEMDDASDAFIRQSVHAAFPTHNIISEEEAPTEQDSPYTWVVDPLDGTINYTTGISDYWAVSIALVHKQDPVLGVIFAPERNDLFVAQQGKGATCNGKTIRTSTGSSLQQAVCAMDYGHGDRAAHAPLISKLMAKDGMTYLYCFGCVTVSLCNVAAGSIGSYAALDLGAWDMAAGVVINREAGNTVTNIRGEQWKLGDRSILAANPSLHSVLLKFLR